MLNPHRKIKPVDPKLTYKTLEDIVWRAFFGEDSNTNHQPLESYRMIFIDDLPDGTIKTEQLTLKEIKSRFPLTPDEVQSITEIQKDTSETKEEVEE